MSMYSRTFTMRTSIKGLRQDTPVKMLQDGTVAPSSEGESIGSVSGFSSFDDFVVNVALSADPIIVLLKAPANAGAKIYGLQPDGAGSPVPTRPNELPSALLIQNTVDRHARGEVAFAVRLAGGQHTIHTPAASRAVGQFRSAAAAPTESTMSQSYSGGTAGDQFRAAVDAKVKAGMARDRAVVAVASENPDLHRRFVQEANPGKSIR